MIPVDPRDVWAGDPDGPLSTYEEPVAWAKLVGATIYKVRNQNNVVDTFEIRLGKLSSGLLIASVLAHPESVVLLRTPLCGPNTLIRKLRDAAARELPGPPR